PAAGKLPLLVTGSSRQDPNWIAQHSDGWIIYPRNASAQAGIVRDFQARVAAAGRQPQPVMQPLYIDLVTDDDAEPQPIHLGFKSGKNALISYLKSLEAAGINHVAINLRFSHSNIETTMKRLADEIMPSFEE
ncbi:MAG: LLM class flavin-dependent oxidoreductase, partial [Chloroflexota bacterium]